MNRIGIYLFWDKSGIVSPHVTVALNAFRPHFSRIVVIVNGTLPRESLQILREHSDSVIARPNTGFDVWGYKHVIEAIGFERLSMYEEVVLFNYTFFAPIGDLGAMFADADKHDVDFWGVTEYRDHNHHFVQSYFIAIRQSILKSDLFRDYWTNMPMINSIDESIEHHEKAFTRVFSNAGYKWRVCYENAEDEVGNTTLAMPDILIRRGCPLLKYRALAFPVNNLQAREGTHPTKTIETIREVSDYDTNLLEQYLVRVIPPQQFAANFSTVRLSGAVAGAWPQETRVAVVLRLSDPDQVALLAKKLMPLLTRGNVWHLYLSVSEAALAETFLKMAGIETAHTIQVQAETDQATHILLRDFADSIAASEVDYIYYASTYEHGRKINSWARNRINFYVGNLAGSDAALETVMNLFSEKPHIGAVVSPQAYYADRLEESYWGPSRKDCRELATVLEVDAWIEEMTPLMAAGQTLWLRRQSFADLLADYRKARAQLPEMDDDIFGYAFGRIWLYLAALRGQGAWRVISDEGLRENLSGLEWGAFKNMQGTSIVRSEAAQVRADAKARIDAMTTAMATLAKQAEDLKKERDQAVAAAKHEVNRFTTSGKTKNEPIRIDMNIDKLLEENQKLKASVMSLTADIDHLRGDAGRVKRGS